MSGFSTKNVKEINVMAPDPSGKKEGCKMTDVSFDAEKGYLDFTFIDKTDAELRHREFEPIRQDFHKTDEDFDKSVGLVMARVKHIVGRYVGTDKAGNLEGKDWADFCKNVIKMLGTSYKDVICSLKVILVEQTNKATGKKGWYSALPKVPSFISTEKYPKDFTINREYDKFEVPGTGPASETGGASNPPKADF